MAKWADFVITRVRYNAAGTHIDHVEVADDTGDALGAKRSESRSTVIANLKARKSYVTAPPSRTTSGSVEKGAAVEVIVVNGAEYIRTDRNGTARDNLGELPTY